MAPNLIKIGVYAYLSNGNVNKVSNFNSEKVNKRAYFEPYFDQPLTLAKIAQNRIRIVIHTYLSKRYLNPLSKLYSEKVDKSASFQDCFEQHEQWPK